MSRKLTGGVFRPLAFATLLAAILGMSPDLESAQPLSLGRFSTPEATGTHELAFIGEWGTGQYHDLFAQGDYAFAAADGAGMDVVDISDPSDPEIVATALTEYHVYRVHLSGGNAFVITRSPGGGDTQLEIFDVSDPLDPAPVGTVSRQQKSDTLGVRSKRHFRV